MLGSGLEERSLIHTRKIERFILYSQNYAKNESARSVDDGPKSQSGIIKANGLSTVIWIIIRRDDSFFFHSRIQTFRS